MKRIIDIPEEVVTAIQNGEDYRYDIHTAIAQGIPYEPKGDLISREALKKALKDAHINMKLTFDIATFNCVKNTIDNAPTVEPEILIKPIAEIKCEITEEEKQRIIELLRKEKPKIVKLEPERPQGEWISSYRECKCSICNFKTVVDTYRYCPNCGADMRGGAE